MGKADLHIHTSHSDGMANVPQLLDYVQERTDLDIIAVTEHDDLIGSLEARERWARGNFRFKVVPGMEVTTIEGHLLALYIESPVRCLRPVEETIEAVHRQGGVCIVAHPFTWMTRGMGLKHIRRVIASERDGVSLDGIEVTNGTVAGRVGARKARELNDAEFGLAEVGGSDAHFLEVIGSGHTEFPGRTPEDLRRAIEERTTSGVTGEHPSLRQLGLRNVVRQTYRGIMSTPRAMGWGPTAYSFIQRILTVR